MKKLSFLLFFFWSLALVAQVPPGYYDPANGLTGQTLQAALHNIIKDHTSQSYNSIIVYFESTDKKPPDIVWDMYSDVPEGTPPYVYHYNAGDECGNYSGEGDCYNREHSWPKSWFGGEVYPMYSDLFHIYPTDGWVNGKRADYPYGEVGTATWTSLNGSRLGNCTWPGYSGVVFEPIDEYKGDFARSYFYMSVRYYTEDSGWPGSPMVSGSQLKPWALAMMMQWSEQDPVSLKETDRNNAVYQIQDNRNPFIDHPEYANLIWGPGAVIPGKTTAILNVHPNPVIEKCKIDLPSELNRRKIYAEAFSAYGNRVHLPVIFEENSISLDLSDQPAGIYFITVTGPEGANFQYHAKLVRK